MTGKIKDLLFDFDGKQTVMISLNGDYRDMFDRLKDVTVDVNIRKHFDKRSVSANKYFHVLVGKIAEDQGVGENEVKRKLVCDYGALLKGSDGHTAGLKLPETVDIDFVYPYARCFDVRVENGTAFKCYVLYKRTRFMTSKEMCRLIDGAIYEAKNIGIETDTPEELKRLKSLWEDDDNDPEIPEDNRETAERESNRTV